MQIRWWWFWVLGTGIWCGSAFGADWAQWGGGDTRNMVSAERGLPDTFAPGTKSADGGEIDLATTRNVKWIARLGTQTYSSPTIAGGRVYIGCNNGAPRDSRFTDDRSILMCFEEATGKFLWQLVVSKLAKAGNFNGDYPGLGICSTPTVKDGRVFLTTTRSEAVCLDANGLANGNDGPFRDEGEYIAAGVRMKPGKPPTGAPPGNVPRGPFAPLELRPTDADILWRYDFEAELDVWPQDATDCSPLVLGDLVYVCTSNGVDLSHKRLPSPEAPSFVALDKLTGRLVAADDAAIGPRIFHGEWSSPSLAKVNGKNLILLGAGDGFCYAYDPVPAPAPSGQGKVLHTVWRCDCNPPQYRTREGRKLPYNQNAEGPSEVIGTPVFYQDRVYVTIGQDTRHGPGPGALTCMDATRTGDISREGVVWRYTDINRSFSTPSVADGLVYVADVLGTVHCLDAKTGQCYWKHETKGQMVGSTLVADGKIYCGNESGKLTILAAGKEARLLNEIRLGSPIHSTPVVANGVLYVPTQRYLYAVRAEAK